MPTCGKPVGEGAIRVRTVIANHDSECKLRSIITKKPDHLMLNSTFSDQAFENKRHSLREVMTFVAYLVLEEEGLHKTAKALVLCGKEILGRRNFN